MKKLTLLLSTFCLVVFSVSAKADHLVLSARGSQVGNITNGSYYVIAGYAQNGTKSTLALRNGDTNSKSYTFTLRDALNIPANVSGSIKLYKAFSDQAALTGLTEGGSQRRRLYSACQRDGQVVKSVRVYVATESPTMLGDANGDGKVTLADVAKTIDYATTGKSTPLTLP